MRPRALLILLLAGVATSTLSRPASAGQEAGGTPADAFSVQWQLRAVYLSPASDQTSSGRVLLNGGAYGELSGELPLRTGWSTELAVGVPQYFDLKNSVAGERVRLIPLSWTLKYDFAPRGNLHPYLGAGLGYASLRLDSPDTQASVQRSASGASWAVQGGCDFFFSDAYFLSVELRYLGALNPGYYRIAPLLPSVGIGARWK